VSDRARSFESVAAEYERHRPEYPDEALLQVAVPEAEALLGPAEAIPLPDANVEAAFAGQAFHWFDRSRALPELHRVIEPGGRLVLLWNWWNERDPLQRELGELIGYAGHEPYRNEELPGEPWFRELGRTIVETLEESSPDALVGYLSTASAFLTAEPEEREASLRAVHELASRYGKRFPLPRLTYVFAFERLE
jgi:SAM-dependent methyltransferase